MNCKMVMKQNSCFTLSSFPWSLSWSPLTRTPSPSIAPICRLLAQPLQMLGAMPFSLEPCKDVLLCPVEPCGKQMVVSRRGMRCFTCELIASSAGYGSMSWEQLQNQVPHWQPANLMSTVCSSGSRMLWICFSLAIFCCLCFVAWQPE